MKRAELHGKIVKYLTLLNYEVEILNSLNLSHLNIYAEKFYADLFNLSFGYNLKCNTKSNDIAIDLSDDVNSIAIQITSNATTTKYHDTLEKFLKNKLHEKYKKLIIVVLGTQSINHKAKIILHDNFRFDIKNDVWYLKQISQKVFNEDTEKLEAILYFLEQELEALMTKSNTYNQQNAFVFNADFKGDKGVFNSGNNVTINVSHNYQKKELTDLQKLFDSKMYKEARLIASELITDDPSDIDKCFYYILSEMSGRKIIELDKNLVERLYNMLDRFLDTDSFVLLWLLLFFEYTARKITSAEMSQKKENLTRKLPQYGDYKKILLIDQHIKLTSSKAPEILEFFKKGSKDKL